jgi:AraC-like DNA-binding protein
MAYNAKKLAEEIDACLSRSPRITLSQMAQDLGVSRRTITRLLGRCRGASYRSYRQSVLLKIALQRLEKTREPIKEIVVEPLPPNGSRTFSPGAHRTFYQGAQVEMAGWQ